MVNYYGSLNYYLLYGKVASGDGVACVRALPVISAFRDLGLSDLGLF